LGTHRHCSGCGNAVPNPHTQSYPTTDRYTCCVRSIGNANSDGNSYSNSDSDRDGHCYRDFYG
jgi:hypothetical protein